MNFRDRILRFQQYALTNSTSIYNEDSVTAQQLNIVNANKIKECLLAVEDLTQIIDNFKAQLVADYNGDSEELELGITGQITAIKEQVNKSYVSIFNENAMTSLELAGCTAKAVNECLKSINMLADLCLDIDKAILLSYVSEEEMLEIGEEV